MTNPVETNCRRDFFISYNSADREWAEWVGWHLEEAGYSVVIQAWDFRPGSNFVLQMEEAAEKADRTIAVLSNDYLEAAFTAAEWAEKFAQDPMGQKGLLIPIRVEKCEPKGFLRTIVFVDLVGLDESHAKNALLCGVISSRSKPKTAPAFPRTTPPTHFARPIAFPGDRALVVRRRLGGWLWRYRIAISLCILLLCASAVLLLWVTRNTLQLGRYACVSEGTVLKDCTLGKNANGGIELHFTGATHTNEIVTDSYHGAVRRETSGFVIDLINEFRIDSRKDVERHSSTLRIAEVGWGHYEGQWHFKDPPARRFEMRLE